MRQIFCIVIKNLLDVYCTVKSSFICVSDLLVWKELELLCCDSIN